MKSFIMFSLILSCMIGIHALVRVDKETPPVIYDMPEELPPPQYISFNTKGLSSSQIEFLDMVSEDALRARDKYSILPSIKVAQAILESGWGEKELAQKANNYFGIKCFSKRCHKDHCIVHHDDHPDDRFKIYPSYELSSLAHSKLITNNNYRSHLEWVGNKYDGKWPPYKIWAVALKNGGYATSPTYVEKLTRIIEQYQLYKLDDKNLLKI